MTAAPGNAVRAAAALLALGAALLLGPPGARAEAGFLPGDAGFAVVAREADGSLATRASTHPESLSTTIGVDPASGDLRDLAIERPAGLVENPAVVDTCTLTEFRRPRESPFQVSASGESCPDDSQVGTLAVRLGGGEERTFGLFSLVAPPGAPALLGASPFGMPLTFTPAIQSTSGAYRTALVARDLSQQLALAGLTLTVWGNPWYVGHDEQRGDCLNEVDPANGFGEPALLEKEPQTSPPSAPFYQPGTCSVGNPKAFPVRAYLTLPTTCAASLQSRAVASFWQHPSPVARTFVHRDAGGGPLTLAGCDSSGLRPEGASAKPNSDRAASPTGFQFELAIDQANLLKGTSEAGRLIPETRAPSQVKTAVVDLPRGMTINPSLAVGLSGCSPARFAAETVASAPGAGCPNQSKIGEMIVQSPLFERQIEGSVYLATPGDNPFGSLLALYLLAKAPDRGVMVKLAGQVRLDPVTGQVRAVFDDLPQLPYESLTIRLRDGQRSPLASPPSCGTYESTIALSPWLDPAHGYTVRSPFALGRGPEGGACPQAPAPFAPGAVSGTENRNAGSYSPFHLLLSRGDADQEITSYSAELPTGLLGKIAGVPFCPEAAIEAARHRDGAAEAAHPSCPAASLVGRTVSGYGIGSVLAYAPGNLYLAGPYHGAPLSIVAVNSATVGPFDLGVIIVRSAIRVDPTSARVWIDSAGSDPIPHILRGVPVHLRDVRVDVDRPGFTLNPTGCDPTGLTSTLTGAGPLTGETSRARIASPFQVSFCSSLGFAPRISLRLKGGTRRGAYPSLRATVTPRPGDAGIDRATVVLPPSEFLAQAHIGTICGREQFARRACPPRSVYGWARAETPLLEVPLEGPVVLRASENQLPDLAVALRGRGVDIDLVGRIDAVKGRLRASFAALPDAPVSRFVLTLRGGRRGGLLVNSDNVCRAAPARALFVGHNNAGVLRRPFLSNPRCKRQRRAKHRAKRHRGHARHGRGRR